MPLPHSISYRKYLSFKQQLLTLMISNDALSILQSGVFEKYEDEMFEADKLQNRINRMQAIIKQYNIDDLKVNVIQKRSHSCQSLKNQNKKIRKLEQQSKIDLMVWSNIMYNHFRRQQKQLNILDKQNISLLNFQTQRNNTKIEQINKSFACLQLQKSILFDDSNTQKHVQKYCMKILKNPSMKNIKLILRQIYSHIQDEGDKIISLLNQLRKENDKLQKNVQDYSLKQLQHIVKIKQLQKRIYQMENELVKAELKARNKEEEMRDKQSNFNKTILLKMKEMQHFQQNSNRKNYIEELKQKMAIDSIRRTTLCTLNRQKFEFQLKKQKLGILAPSLQIDQNEEINEQSEETRCDDQ